MEKNLCIECNKRPVYIKKRGLCPLCYGRLRKKNKSLINPEKHKYCKPTEEKMVHEREMEFVRNFFIHNNWIYQPANFKFNGQSYAPDFYDIETNMFIEVAGTRQAYHKNKEKYKTFREYYPKINFEIRLPDGSLFDEDSYHKGWNNQK